MLKQFMSSLRSFAAPAVIAVAGLFVTGEQAQAANINLEEGTVTVERGDALDNIIASLADQGVQTTRETFQAANPELTNVHQIRVDQVLKIPGLDSQTASTPTAEDVAAATEAMYALFDNVKGEALAFAGVEAADLSPAALWGIQQPAAVTPAAAVEVPAAEVPAYEVSALGHELLMNALDDAKNSKASTLLLNVDLPAADAVEAAPAVVETPAQTAPAAEEAPAAAEETPAVEEMTPDEQRIFLTETPSDEELLAASDEMKIRKMTGTLASYSEAHVPYLLEGYKLAIEMGNQMNIDDYQGDLMDYDGTLTSIPEAMIAQEIKSRHADYTEEQIDRAVQGFQAGAQNMTANDKPCDGLTETFFINAMTITLGQQPEVVREALASVAWDSYDRGADEKDCVDCKVEEEVIRPRPRPDNLVPPPAETYEVERGDALCGVVREIDRSFTGIVEQNHLKSPYLLDYPQTLDLTNVEELDEEADELFEQYCTGTGPILPPVVTHVPSNPGTPVTPTPIPPYVPPVQGGCEILHTRPFGIDTFRLKSLSSEFLGLCGCADEVFEHNFSGRTPLWGDIRLQCPREDNDNDPEPQPEPEQPGGGCQSGCGGGGPNDDLDTDIDVGNGSGGDTPPGPRGPALE